MVGEEVEGDEDGEGSSFEELEEGSELDGRGAGSKCFEEGFVCLAGRSWLEAGLDFHLI